MAEPVVHDGPLSRYLEGVSERGDVPVWERSAEEPPAERAAPAPTPGGHVSLSDVPVAEDRAERKPAPQRRGRGSAEDLAYAAKRAWGSDDLPTQFAERFKYVVATSFLLTPSLSIGMYDAPAATAVADEAQPRPFHVEDPVPRRAATTVETTMPPSLSSLNLVDAAVLLATVLATRTPLMLVLPLVAALAACVLISHDLAAALGAAHTMRFTLERAPDAQAPRFLAAGEPTTAWVADERVRLASMALQEVTRVVHAAHACDRGLRDAILAVQEVELVSRGYNLSSPLPPISRIEAAGGFATQPRARAQSADGAVPPVPPAHPRRLEPLRKAISETLDQLVFACQQAQVALQPLVDPREAALLSEVGHLAPRRRDENAGAAPSPVRSLALSVQATPPHAYAEGRRGLALSESLPNTPRTPTTPRTPRTPRQDGFPALSRFSEPRTSVEACFSEGTPPLQRTPSAPTPRSDRLSLAQLRSRFESMHAVRRTMLWLLLALDYTMAPTDARSGADLASYWDDGVVRGVLQRVTAAFSAAQECLAKIVRQSMGASAGTANDARGAAPPVPAPSDEALSQLREHVGLADRMNEMARLLRTIQCKLHVCDEDLRLGAPVYLHGGAATPAEVLPGDAYTRVHALFDSVRHDLLALSGEWEAGLRIVSGALTARDAPAPAADRAEAGPEASGRSSPASDGGPLTDTFDGGEPREAAQDPDGALGAAAFSEAGPPCDAHEAERRDVLAELLLQSATPAHLPPPGLEQVFEAAPEPRPTHRVRQPRAERIKQQAQQRAAERAAASAAAEPQALVAELHDVFAQRPRVAQNL